MPATIPDLWSDDIKVDVVPPLAILRAQAGFLEQKTRGILQARVVSTTEFGRQEQHALDLIAPALNQYRKTLLVAKHPLDVLYPVIVRAESFSPPERWFPAQVGGAAGVFQAMNPNSLKEDERRANTQDEFIGLVRDVLRSGYALSIIQSLIARSNEAGTAEADRNGSPPSPESGDRPTPPAG